MLIPWIFKELHSTANNSGLLCSNVTVLLKRIWITLAKTLQAEKLDQTETNVNILNDMLCILFNFM